MAYTSMARWVLKSQRTPMPIGTAGRTPSVLHHAIVFSSMTLSWHGPPSDRRWCCGPVQKLSTTPS
jgi:hypothetical protein